MRIRLLAVFLLLSLSAPLFAQQKPAPASPAKPKIRTITAFFNLDRSQYQQQIADALQMLRRAKTIFESRGYEVQTIRIATQPFAEYAKGLSTQQAIAFFKDLDALAEKEKFLLGIGPAMLDPSAPESQADLLADILANTKHIRGSIVIAGEDGVRWRAIGATARAIKKLEDTDHSQGNFNLGASADVPPLSPFFNAAYVTGFGHQFAIGLESANVVAEAFRDAPDIGAAGKKLTSMLSAEAFEIERHANRIDMETGWAYVGIDLSPAPLKDVSIGAAIENLIAKPFGTAGTLTAAATITAAIKAIQVKQTGYSGLMLPVLEDSRIAERWSQGQVSLEGLLSYSAVCGTGLDTIPLPGDITVEQLDMILADVATLAVKGKKPLSARLMPIKGKSAGDTTDFNDPFLVNAVIQPFEPK
ncbi:MAG: hypothetical protein NVS9B14_09710 [Candidatus Acidiferrum sp.]